MRASSFHLNEATIDSMHGKQRGTALPRRTCAGLSLPDQGLRTVLASLATQACRKTWRPTGADRLAFLRALWIPAKLKAI
jgi:hypothetical protein